MSTRLALLSLPLTLILLAACSSEPPPPPGTLIGAVLAGDLPSAEAALDAGADPNETDDSGGTALHRAAGGGAIDFIEHLLDEGADPDAQDARGLTPLLVAIASNQTEAALLLIEEGADVDLGYGDETPLKFAAIRSNPKLVEALLDEGAELPHPDPEVRGDRSHPIQYSYKKQDLASFTLILDADRRRLVESQFMVEALSLSTQEGRREFVEVMLDRGVDPNRIANDGFAALYHAAYDGDSEIVRLLLEAGADPDLASGEFGTALFGAIRSQAPTRWDVLARLLDEDPDLEVRSGDVTPLLLASLNHDVRSVALLIEAGAEVDARTRDGGTALQFARGNDRLVQLLRASGAEV